MTTQAYFTVRGLEEYMDAILKAGKDIDAAAQRALTKGAPILQSEMQDLVPIDEGNLFEHIQVDGPHQMGNFSWVEVGVIHKSGSTDAKTARYGNAQEYGWSSGGKFHPGKSYIRPAIDRKRALVLRTIRESLKAEGLAD
jgi:hypothetical protein